MKVLLVSHYSGRYGANRSLVDLSVHLMQRGVDVMVILPKGGKIESDLKSNGICYKVVYHRIWIKAIGSKYAWLRRSLAEVANLMADLRIYALAKARGVDLIHINSSCTPVGFRASRWMKIPLVWHIREYLEEDYGLAFFCKEKALRGISGAERVIAVSKDLAQKYRGILGEKIGVIYNGVSNESKEVANILGGPAVNILMVGVLNEAKRQLDAIRAVAIANMR